MNWFARLAVIGVGVGSCPWAQTDLFEWTPFASLTVVPHVVQLAFSPDGAKGAIATDDGAVQIFDLDNRSLSLRRITQEPARVISLQFSTDSSALMLAREDGFIQICSLTGGGTQSIRTNGKLVAAALSRGGALVASSAGDRSVSVWEISSATLGRRYQPKSKRPFFALGFLGHDSSLVAVSGSGDIYEWDIKTGGVLHHTRDEDDRITAASLGESGDLVAVGTEITTFQKGPLSDLNLAGTRDRSIQNRIRIYDRGSVAKTLDGINGEVGALSLSRDGRFISFVRHLQKDSILTVYDVQRGVEVAAKSLPARATAMAFSHNGQWLGTATEGGDMLVHAVKGVTNTVDPSDLRGVIYTITSKSTEPLLSTPLLPVAVIDFRSNNTDDGTGRAVADMVRARIAEGENVRVVERLQMEKLIKELNINLSNLVDQSTAINFGKMLGAGKMIFGSVSKLGTRYTINVRMVDVATSVIDGEREITCEPCSEAGLQEAVIRLKRVLVK